KKHAAGLLVSTVAASSNSWVVSTKMKAGVGRQAFLSRAGKRSLTCRSATMSQLGTQPSTGLAQHKAAGSAAAPALSWRKQLCFTLILLGILLVAAETGVRLFARLTNRQRLYQLDAVAGYTCKPSLVGMTKRYGSHEFHYSTDERGFRITKPAGAQRTGTPIV